MQLAAAAGLVSGRRTGKAADFICALPLTFKFVFLLVNHPQSDTEELLHFALASLASNERFVAAFRGDDGRCLRQRVRRIAQHFADRSEGNACREVIAGLYKLLDDDGSGVQCVDDSIANGACPGLGRRKRQAAGEWPLASGASEEQLQRQKAVLQRLRFREQVPGARSSSVFACLNRSVAGQLAAASSSDFCRRARSHRISTTATACADALSKMVELAALATLRAQTCEMQHLFARSAYFIQAAVPHILKATERARARNGQGQRRDRFGIDGAERSITAACGHLFRVFAASHAALQTQSRRTRSSWNEITRNTVEGGWRRGGGGGQRGTM